MPLPLPKPIKKKVLYFSGKNKNRHILILPPRSNNLSLCFSVSSLQNEDKDSGHFLCELLV